jgi:hypothetical protein
VLVLEDDTPVVGHLPAAALQCHEMYVCVVIIIVVVDVVVCCCLLSVVCCLLSVVSCLLFVVCCLLSHDVGVVGMAQARQLRVGGISFGKNKKHVRKWPLSEAPLPRDHQS